MTDTPSQTKPQPAKQWRVVIIDPPAAARDVLRARGFEPIAQGSGVFARIFADLDDAKQLVAEAQARGLHGRCSVYEPPVPVVKRPAPAYIFYPPAPVKWGAKRRTLPAPRSKRHPAMTRTPIKPSSPGAGNLKASPAAGRPLRANPRANTWLRNHKRSTPAVPPEPDKGA